MKFEKMTHQNADDVKKMFKEFYASSAVDHEVSEEVFENTFAGAVNQTNGFLGVVVQQEEKIVGYGFVSQYFCSEVGGIAIMMEELFLQDSFLGQGIGTAYFQYVKSLFPNAKRFRLEVTQSNVKGIELYKRWGFEFLNYRQMILDV